MFSLFSLVLSFGFFDSIKKQKKVQDKDKSEFTGIKSDNEILKLNDKYYVNYKNKYS